MGQRRRLVIAAALVAALATSSLPSHAATPTGRDGTVEKLIGLLAKSGIAVVQDSSDTEPIREVEEPLSPVRFLRDQVENMALELSADGGVPGARLDELAPAPDGALPISYLIAGYITSKDTIGARAAKKLMGKQDYAHAPRVQFPAVVLALFTSDLARDFAPSFAAPPLGATSSAPTGGPAGGASVQAGSVGAVCSALSSFISDGVDAVYDAITFENADPDSAAAYWNEGIKWFIEGVGAVLGGLIDVVFPFLEYIKTALGVIAAVHAITSLLVNWTVTVKPDPSSLHFGVLPNDGEDGGFVATVNAPNDIEWPDGVPECAQLLNITLPDLTPGAAPVAWTLTEHAGDISLILDSELEAKLDGNRQASLTYVTNTETKKEHNKGELIEDDTLEAGITVDRSDVETLRAMLKTVILNQVPDVVAPFVNPKLEAELTPLIDKLTEVAEPFGQAEVTITHHKLDPCKTPNPKIDPCLIGEWESFQLALPLPPELSYAGGTGAIMTIDADGSIKIDYDPSGSFIVGVGSLGGTGKLKGFGTALAKTEYDEEVPGSGTITSVVASLDDAQVFVSYAGFEMTIAIPGTAAFNGSYVVDFLDDPVMIDRLTFTVNTSVGPVISVWYRTEDVQGG